MVRNKTLKKQNIQKIVNELKNNLLNKEMTYYDIDKEIVNIINANIERGVFSQTYGIFENGWASEVINYDYACASYAYEIGICLYITIIFDLIKYDKNREYKDNEECKDIIVKIRKIQIPTNQDYDNNSECINDGNDEDE